MQKRDIEARGVDTIYSVYAVFTLFTVVTGGVAPWKLRDAL